MTDQPDTPPTAAAQTPLRDRIAQVLRVTSRARGAYEVGDEKWDHHKHGDLPGHNYAFTCALCTNDIDTLADAVLAVLPAPADRAAVLREAADFVGNDDDCDCGGCDTCVPNKLAIELRRLADEAQQGETASRVTAALYRSAEQDVTRVIELYERWTKAGPPPLGTLMARWWDARLVELHDAIVPPTARHQGEGEQR